MKLPLILVTALFTGCATQAPVSQPQPQVVNAPAKPDFTTPVRAATVLDEGCAEIATTAKAIAIARNAGIPATQVELIIGGAKKFPVGPVIREVYLRRDIDPNGGAQNSYGVCTNIGYDVMVQNLVKADADYMAALERQAVDSFVAAKRAQHAAGKVYSEPKPLKKPKSRN